MPSYAIYQLQWNSCSCQDSALVQRRGGEVVSSLTNVGVPALQILEEIVKVVRKRSSRW